MKGPTDEKAIIGNAEIFKILGIRAYNKKDMKKILWCVLNCKQQDTSLGKYWTLNQEAKEDWVDTMDKRLRAALKDIRTKAGNKKSGNPGPLLTAVGWTPSDHD
eukprot:5287201-Karenia_brevis.AAC.1